MVSRCFCWFLHRLNCCRVCYSIEPWEKRWSKRLSSWMYVSDLLLCRSILTYRQRVTTFPPFPSRGPIRIPYSVKPRHLPFPCHTSLHHHLPTWHFFILISDLDSLCLPSYLRRRVRYSNLLWQALPRPLPVFNPS